MAKLPKSRCLRANLTPISNSVMPAIVKVFGCRPHDGGAARTGPASANLQGRKPRWGNIRPCRRRYGDLSAVDEMCD